MNVKNQFLYHPIQSKQIFQPLDLASFLITKSRNRNAIKAIPELYEKVSIKSRFFVVAKN